MSLYRQVLNNIEDRRTRALSGQYNSIPAPFPKLAKYYSGIEKGRYELVTASRKIGKTQYADFAYV